jgi:hypothetical protein
MKINKTNIIKGIFFLCSQIEINLNCYDEILNHIEIKRKNPYWKLLQIVERNPYLYLIAQNHLFSSILILNTLLSHKADEISPLRKEIFGNLNNDAKKKLNILKDKFIKSKLKFIRNKKIAHITDFPKGPFPYLIPKKDLYEETKYLFNKLRIWIYQNFKNTYTYFSISECKAEINNILKIIEQRNQETWKVIIKNWNPQNSI